MRTKCRSIATFHRPVHSHWSLPLNNQKLKKNYNWKFFFLFWSKIAIYLSLGLQKVCPSYRRSLQISKEAIQHFKTWTFTNFFSTFVGLFCPPGSGSGFRIRIRIRIHRPNWIQIQYGSGSGSGSGSTTLLKIFLKIRIAIPRLTIDESGTRRLSDSPRRGVSDFPTRRVGESPTLRIFHLNIQKPTLRLDESLTPRVGESFFDYEYLREFKAIIESARKVV